MVGFCSAFALHPLLLSISDPSTLGVRGGASSFLVVTGTIQDGLPTPWTGRCQRQGSHWTLTCFSRLLPPHQSFCSSLGVDDVLSSSSFYCFSAPRYLALPSASLQWGLATFQQSRWTGLLTPHWFLLSAGICSVGNTSCAPAGVRVIQQLSLLHSHHPKRWPSWLFLLVTPKFKKHHSSFWVVLLILFSVSLRWVSGTSLPHQHTHT